jgi:hypothetical protein
MLKQTAFLIAALLLSAVVLQAQQQSEAPFAVVERAVRDEHGGWNGNKETLSRVFDDERRRLGPQFGSELTKWLGNDPQKHYWVSGFPDWETFLHGNKPPRRITTQVLCTETHPQYPNGCKLTPPAFRTNASSGKK